MTQTMEVSTIDIAKLNLKEGDTLFVNADTIDIERLRRLLVFGDAKVAIVPVICMPGMSVADQLAVTHVEAANEQLNG